MSDEKTLEVGLDDDVVEQFTLVSKEKESFVISKRAAMMSGLIKAAVEGDTDVTEIPLKIIKSDVLRKVVEYMMYHVDHPSDPLPRPIRSKTFEELLSAWDVKFIDVEHTVLFEVVQAANYMDIKPLLDLGCAKIGFMTSSKTPDQIRETFGIEEPFSEAEETELRNSTKWRTK